MEDLTGREFGSYRVVAAVRQGGMAAVYKAYQPAVDRYVALKILSREFTADPQFLRRFRHEAKIVAQFQHPHIMPVFDFGESGGHAFLAMPFVNGGTLGELLNKEHLSVSAIVRIVGQICEALDYAHQKGVVHRDIKPSNILMLDRQNCLVADFGLARISADSTQLTIAGAVMGTPAYMSPEQASGQTAEATSDLYSLGIVLYELLTGRVPFVADTPVAVMVRHLTATVPPPRHLKPELSPALEAVVLKSLARQPADRFASATEFHASLVSATSGHEAPHQVSAVAAPLPKSDQLQAVDAVPPRQPKSNRVRIAAAFLVTLSILGVWLWRVEYRATRIVPRPPSSPTARAGDRNAAAPPAQGLSQAPAVETVRSTEKAAVPQAVRVSPSADHSAGEVKPVAPPPQDKASSRSEQSHVVDAVGGLQIRSKSGAEVLVDRSSRGMVAPNGTLVISNLTVGSHDVQVLAPGMKPFYQVVTVSGNQEVAIEATLESLAPAPVETLGSKAAPVPEATTEPASAPVLTTPKKSNVDGGGHTVRAGLDEVRLFVDQMPPAKRLVIQPFSASDSDLKQGETKDETKTMQADGPRMLADRFIAKLKDLGGFKEVFLSADGAATAGDTLVVDGKFVELDPGNRAKRYFVGRSAVAVEGTVKASDGTVLATFRQRRLSVIGIGGGALGKLSSDTKNIGEDIAKFISEWAKGNLN